ncbi:MAG: GbsR/MarR family transcriptional regulator [Candidatus Dormibacteria bacterium]
MQPETETARATFIDGMGRIAEFWGLGRVMGRLWAVLYLSPEAMTLDDLTHGVGITKGHASTSLRALLRLGLVHRSWRPGDRRDYYEAETDFWRFTREILRERQQREFDRALASTSEALAQLESARTRVPPTEFDFVHRRLVAIRDFHATIDRAVATLLRLDDLRGAVLELVLRFGRREGGET